MFGLTPRAYDRFRALYASLWSPTILDPSVLELCRLRVATLLACETEARVRFVEAAEHGLTEAKISVLPHYGTSPLFSDLERRCLAYVEQYVLDPHAIEDRDFGLLREHLSEQQIAALTLAAAMFDALTRFRLGLSVGPFHTAPSPPPAREYVRRDLTVVDPSGQGNGAS